MTNFTDYNDFFLFLGGLLLLAGIVYRFFLKNLREIFISEEEISKLETSSPTSTVKISLPKVKIRAIILGLIIGGFFFNQILIWKMSLSGIMEKPFSVKINITRKK